MNASYFYEPISIAEGHNKEQFPEAALVLIA